MLKIALAKHGLELRGSFVTHSSDNIPALDEHNGTTSLALIGNIGSSIWPSFSTSEEYKDGLAHPLDRWSKRIGEQLANDFGGLAFYPLDGPPYWPFLSWAQKAEELITSPLGLKFHPQYGLWHAYRFALLLPYALEVTDKPLQHHNTFDCSSCVEQPCLRSCPVNAFDGKNYDTDSCTHYLNENPQAYCNTHGCVARHACPVGQKFAYCPQHAQFHMQAFTAARKSER